ncbi:hypothetical protein BDV29DRAFT_142816 [Aspergillus leporis]|uniref:Epidermal growth factor receptor-like transmembrane-juxtamembrane segment domain-containing protein n=1 Tax=Aspergillus leporis TaxID=41062 RepID=A0A5N5WWS9_9EURO|nr:hypothetical protein BDV29DRAFT_142816 [Aspergillus leporis]
MAHHGNRHPRYSRLMKRTNRSTAGNNDTEPEHGEQSLVHGTVLNNPTDKMRRQAQDGSQLGAEAAASQEGQTSVQATAIVDSNPPATPDATAATPTPTTDANQTTASEVPTNQSAAAVTPTSPEENPSASPASSTSTADTPSATTTNDPSTTPTSHLVISSASVTATSQTPLSSVSSSETPQPSSSSIASSTSSSTSSSSQTLSSTSSSSSSSTTTTSSTVTSTTTSTTSELSTASSPSDTGVGTSYGWDEGSGATATDQIPLATGSNSSATDSSSQGSGALDSQTKGKIAGGVVGGVAGAMVLVLIAFLLLRRRKANQRRATEVLPPGDMTGTAVGEGSVARSDLVSRRSSNDPLWTASYFAPAFMKRWRQSRLSTHTESTVDSGASERGFQKISGRKIPSVLQSGGDGYGGGFSERSPTMSEQSMNFPPSSPVHPRSPTSQPPPSIPYGMPLDVSYTREAEEINPMVIFRPSPARTPIPGSAAASISNESTVSRIVPMTQGALSPTIPKRPDILGRSHPSFDGSRGSRFTESI